MKELLEQLKLSGKLCELYTDPDSDYFAVGYVVACDSEYYLVETVTFEGRHNGFQCYLVDDLYKVQTDTRYLADIERLMNFYNYEYSRVDIPLVGRDVLAQTLNYAKNHAKVCTIKPLNNYERRISGIVEDVDDEIVTVKMLEQSGRADGVCYVRTEDITSVSVGAEDEIKLDILSK